MREGGRKQTRQQKEGVVMKGEKKESVIERQMGRGVVHAYCPTTQILAMTHTVSHCVCLGM